MARHTIGLEPSRASRPPLPTATIVVCTRKRPAALWHCLNGIAQLEHAPDEVIVIDNTSGDKETEAVALEFGAVYLIEPVEGLSRARNRGFAESTSDIIAYLDDDAIPDPDWLELLLEPFANPQVTLVTGKIVTPASKSQNGTGQPARSLSNKDSEWFAIATFGGLGLGSNMAFRRKTCAANKLFDERLGRGAPFEIAEENFAFASLLSQGHTAVYLPKAMVYHPDGKPTDVMLEARNSIAFSMFLFSEFPNHRLDLIKFLFRRLRQKPLIWPRDSPDPGAVITSGWRVLIAASFQAAALFLKNRRLRDP